MAPLGAAECQQRRDPPGLREARLSLEGHPRNVLGCWNLGYCGMGCPVNAKQSMLVTTIPATLDKGGELLYLARANRLLLDGDKVAGLECLGMDERCVAPNGRRIRVRARHYVLSAAASTPRRFFSARRRLIRASGSASAPSCTVNFSAGLFDRVRRTAVDLSDHFQWDDGVTGRMSTNWRCRRCNRRWPRCCSAASAATTPCAWNSYRIPT